MGSSSERIYELEQKRQRQYEKLLDGVDDLLIAHERIGDLDGQLQTSTRKVEELSADLRSANSLHSKLKDYIIGGVIGALIGALVAALLG